MYLVTGATGNVGSQVVKQLLADGRKVRVFTRDAAKVAHWGNQVEAALGDLNSPETFAKALSGVEGVFLMNGPLDGGIFRQLIAATKAEGSPTVVFLSTLFAGFSESSIGRLHMDKEDVIRASGLPGRFIRAGAFMTNAYQWLGSIKADGAVYNAMGTGKVAPVAAEDIAAVAVHALTDSNPDTEIFEVTGGELLTVPNRSRFSLAQLAGPFEASISPPRPLHRISSPSGLLPRLPRRSHNPSKQFATAKWPLSKTLSGKSQEDSPEPSNHGPRSTQRALPERLTGDGGSFCEVSGGTDPRRAFRRSRPGIEFAEQRWNSHARDALATSSLASTE
jgi:uncharacterized protein YbjT (DUF2867 family)